MEALHILLSALMVSFCIGDKLDVILEKLYGMEKSLHLDITILRDSVASNRQSIENMLDLLNNTADLPSLGDSNGLTTASNDDADKQTAYLKETIERMRKSVSEALGDFEDSMRGFMINNSVEITKMTDFMINTIGEMTSLKQAILDVESSMVANISQHKSETSSNIISVIQPLNEKMTKLLSEHSTLQNNIVDIAVNQETTKEELTSLHVMMCMFHGTFISIKSTNTRLANAKCTGESIQGRVEVIHSGRWGTVCDDDFNNTDATVVCRSLGYTTGEAVGEVNDKAGYFGRGSGDIWLDDVQCKGTESDIFDCPALSIESHNCNHYEDVGVICS